MTHYHEPDREIYQVFAERTLANLRYIWNRADYYEYQGYSGRRDESQKLYEVTQLINSMLGLLVFPSEEVLGTIPDLPIDQLEYARRFYITKDAYPGDKKCTNLRTLITRLRNGVAHFEIEFLDDRKSINSIRFADKYPKETELRWIAHVGVRDLHEFLVWFAEGIASGSLLTARV